MAVSQLLLALLAPTTALWQLACPPSPQPQLTASIKSQLRADSGPIKFPEVGPVKPGQATLKAPNEASSPSIEQKPVPYCWGNPHGALAWVVGW